MASLVVRPDVVDFLDVMLKHQITIRFSESIIQQGSELVGLPLHEARIPGRTGLVVVSVRDEQGKFIYNPSGNLTLDVGSALIVIADNEQLQHLHKLTGGSLNELNLMRSGLNIHSKRGIFCVSVATQQKMKYSPAQALNGRVD